MPLTALLRSQKSEHGFTLVELLVVILIIGILAAIAIPMFLNQRKAAVDASAESDLRNAIPFIESNKKELFADRIGGISTLYLIQADNETKAYNYIKWGTDEENPSAYTGPVLDQNGFPVGEDEIELPESMKSLKLSQGTVIGIFHAGQCHYTMSATNQSGNVSKAYDNDFIEGGYMYNPYAGKIYPVDVYQDERNSDFGGTYDQSREYYSSDAC